MKSTGVLGAARSTDQLDGVGGPQSPKLSLPYLDQHINRKNIFSSEARFPSMSSDQNSNRMQFEEMLETVIDWHCVSESVILLWFWYFVDHCDSFYVNKLLSECEYIGYRFEEMRTLHIYDSKQMLMDDKVFNSQLMQVSIELEKFEITHKILSDYQVGWVAIQDCKNLFRKDQLELIEMVFSQEIIFFPSTNFALNRFKFYVWDMFPRLRKSLNFSSVSELIIEIILSQPHINDDYFQRKLGCMLCLPTVKMDHKLFKTLIKFNLVHIFEAYIRQLPKTNLLFIDFKIFLEALKLRQYGIAFTISEKAPKKFGWSKKYNFLNPLNYSLVQIELFRMLYLEENNARMYAIYFMRRVIFSYKLAYRLLKNMHTVFEDFLVKYEEHLEMFTHMKNPIGFCLLIVELISLLRKRSPNVKDSLGRTREMYLIVVRSLLTLVEEDADVKQILLDKDLGGRTYLSVVMKNPKAFYDLLQYEPIHQLIREVWDPQFEMSVISSETSFMAKILNNQFHFRNHFPYIHDTFPSCSSAFKVNFFFWRESVALRKYTELVLMIFLGFIAVMFVVLEANEKADFNNREQELELKWNRTLPHEDQMFEQERAVALSEHEDNLTQIRSDSDNYSYFIYGYFFWEIWQLIFRHLTYKKVFIFDLSHSPTFFIIASAMYVFVMNRNLFSLPQELEFLDLNVRTMVVFFYFLKLFALALIIKQIGPLTRVIGLLILEVTRFMIIDLMLLLAFAMLFQTLFHNTEFNSELYEGVHPYDSLERAFLTLLDASHFSYKRDYNNLGLSEILLIIVIVLNGIVMFNYLIAILSNTYEKFQERADIEYLNILYVIRENNEYHKTYGAMVVTPYVLVLPLSAFFIAQWLVPNKKTKRKLNKIATYLTYLFFYMPMLMVAFLVINLLLIIPAYLKSLMVLPRFIHRWRIKSKKVVVLWIFLGIPILFFYMIGRDWPRFGRSLLTRDVRENRETKMYDDFLDASYEVASRLNKDHIDYEDFTERIFSFMHFKVNITPVPSRHSSMGDDVLLASGSFAAYERAKTMSINGLKHMSKFEKMYRNDYYFVRLIRPMFYSLVNMAQYSKEFTAQHKKDIYQSFLNNFAVFDESRHKMFHVRRFVNILRNLNWNASRMDCDYLGDYGMSSQDSLLGENHSYRIEPIDSMATMNSKRHQPLRSERRPSLAGTNRRRSSIMRLHKPKLNARFGTLHIFSEYELEECFRNVNDVTRNENLLAKLQHENLHLKNENYALTVEVAKYKSHQRTDPFRASRSNAMKRQSVYVPMKKFDE